MVTNEIYESHEKFEHNYEAQNFTRHAISTYRASLILKHYNFDNLIFSTFL